MQYLRQNITIDLQRVMLEESWKKVLSAEFTKDYFLNIKRRLKEDRARGAIIYPAGNLIFNAFYQTPFAAVRVVIIGQDPYHQPQQAMGLSFSVPQGVRVPPSLQNIYKELRRSILGFNIPQHGDLRAWAQQGVLLLNATLTVEHGKAASHAKIGWQLFTDAAIAALSAQREGIIFLLWGNFAKQKAKLIDATRHHILSAVHPSPLAGGAFIGCNHFAAVNEILQNNNEKIIDWQL